VSTEQPARSEGPSASHQAATLELREVSKRYPGQRVAAIADLSLSVNAGEVCVLVGPSGSGKTTAMRLINRMIPLSGGDILLGGRTVLDREPNELRREIGYVIQQIGLFPHLTVAHNIATVPRLLGWDKARIAARTDELLRLIDLDPDEIGRRYPSQLSGGQRQRVGVARALAADPPLMLMDEPFGAIDPINRSRLQDEFLALQQRVRKTVVFVTHDIDEAIKMGDRIAILREGGRLAQKLGNFKLGAAPEFATRYEGLIGLKKEYGLSPTFVPLAIGITYKAIDDGQVQVFDAFTTDPELLSGKYTPLSDPKGVFGFQNVAPVVKQSVLKAEGPAFEQTINKVSALLTLPAIQKMNQAVAIDQQAPSSVAHQFLAANGLL
jgi:ABC-type proline/glycine betaine transport system ATPase subunit